MQLIKSEIEARVTQQTDSHFFTCKFSAFSKFFTTWLFLLVLLFSLMTASNTAYNS